MCGYVFRGEYDIQLVAEGEQFAEFLPRHEDVIRNHLTVAEAQVASVCCIDRGAESKPHRCRIPAGDEERRRRNQPVVRQSEDYVLSCEISDFPCELFIHRYAAFGNRGTVRKDIHTPYRHRIELSHMGHEAVGEQHGPGFGAEGQFLHCFGAQEAVGADYHRPGVVQAVGRPQLERFPYGISNYQRTCYHGYAYGSGDGHHQVEVPVASAAS